jgi:hypothetical protein
VGRAIFSLIFHKHPDAEADTFKAAAIHSNAAGKYVILSFLPLLKKHRPLIALFLPSQCIDGDYFTNQVKLSMTNIIKVTPNNIAFYFV